MHLATSSMHGHGYDAGSSPIGVRFEVHGISTYPHELPGHAGRKGALDQGPVTTPKTVPSESRDKNIPDAAEQPSQRRGNWCSFVQSRIVSFVHLCKTEKYVIRSQQPCPHGTPDCQKTMYRLAQKPLYEIKRKMVTSLEWKCCPGYIGTSCEHIDPNSILVPVEESTRSETEQEPILNTELSEMMEAIQKQESLLKDTQNDIHQASGNLLDLQNVLENNVIIASNENQTKPEVEDRLLREVFLPHVENFLWEQFNPLWNSFNKSLQHLSSMVKNLSESVENNRKRIDTFLENTVPKKDLHELGTKFESKIQENIDKLDQMKHEMDNNLHAQQTAIHANLTMIKADTDWKIKRNQKLQQAQMTYVNTSIDEFRRGQEHVEDQIQDLTQNITELWLSYNPVGETNKITQINETIDKLETMIKELGIESDAASENIFTLEKWIKELRTEFKNYSHEVRRLFMIKSLIMEENKELLLRQIMELNSTILSIQESNDELLKNCDCQKMTLDILALEEGQRNVSNLLKNVSYGIEDVKQKQGTSKTSLQNSVEDLSLALHLNRQAITSQQEQGRSLAHITAQLQSQAKNFSSDVDTLKMDNGLINNHIKLLESTFNSLLEDAIRHDRALQALLGEDIIELMSEEQPVALQMSILQIYDVLNETLKRLEKQQLTTDSLKRRVHLLEIKPHSRDSLDPSTIFNVEQQTEGKAYDGQLKQGIVEHMEPNHEASRDDVSYEPAYSDIMTLKNDLRHLNVKIKNLESHFTEQNYCNNDTILKAFKPLNTSIGSMKSEIMSLRDLFGGHMHIFQKIFGNYETLLASNTTLDISMVHAFLNKKMKKKKGGELQNSKLGRKDTAQQWQSDGTVRHIPKQDSPVAFSAAFTEGAEGVKMLQFNNIILNYGNAFSSEDGHFTAPTSGVYVFSISVDFGPGSALGHLVFGARQKIALYRSISEQAESLKHSFAVVELQKDEKVWFELLQGSIKKNSYGTNLAGYLIFKT
ncbi:multimerin-2 [Rhinophrynus dorsalis]